MKKKKNFYKVCDEYVKLEQKLGYAILLDEIFININIDELARIIKVIAKKKEIDIDL